MVIFGNYLFKLTCSFFNFQHELVNKLRISSFKYLSLDLGLPWQLTSVLLLAETLIKFIRDIDHVCQLQ